MQVPFYQNSIAPDAGAPPQLRVEPMPASASGENVPAAAAQVGKVAEEIGARLEQHMIAMSKMKAQQEVYDRASSYNSTLQDKAYSQDPNNPGFLTRKGMNAQGALKDFDAMVNGTPAAPGQPGKAPLKNQFMQGLSTYQQKQLDRMIDSHTTVFRGAVIKHEVEQVNAAQEASFKSTLDQQINLGSAVRDADGIQAAQKAVTDTIDGSALWKAKGNPDNVTAQVKQDHVDELVRNAVEANVQRSWQDAKKILAASSASPVAKAALTNTINGARVNQYGEALTHAVLTNKGFATEEGVVNEAKAFAYVQGQIADQEKSQGLPPGHSKTISDYVQNQISMFNTGVKQKQELVINKVSNDIWKAHADGVPYDVAYNKFIKNGQFDNGIERGKAEELYEKVYRRDPDAQDAIANHFTDTQKETLRHLYESEDFTKKFPTSDDKKEFQSTFERQIIEKNVKNPDAINQLFKQSFDKTPTGKPGWIQALTFNKINTFGGQQKESFEIAEQVQKNLALVKAVGGTAAAVKLAQKIGGADKLAPDTDESKAVMALLQRGARPEQINAKSIAVVLRDHAAWLGK